MTTHADALRWRPPPGPDSAQQPAGVHWDAVRAPAHLGRPALDALGAATGAVIRDPYRGDLYWLVPAGTTARWVPLPDVHTYGSACWVEIPPGCRSGGPGPYWLPLAGGGRWLTDAVELRSALLAVVTELYPDNVAGRL